MNPPRLLTFNFHEPYLCLMARTGFPIDVGVYESGYLARPWQTHFRPIPPNITLVPESQWRADLAAGRYDVAVAHNEHNASNIVRDAVTSNTPVVLVCHNRRTYLHTTIGSKEGRKNSDQLLAKLADVVQFVYISESKRRDYGLPGAVIPPGIDVEAYGGYTGAIAAVLRVGNGMRTRNCMFDVDFQEAVCKGFPYKVVGDDPDIPGAQPSTSHEDLVAQYRQHRCYLHVTRWEYEDGYNLALLEALATGTPVVALANPTCPITDGVDGYASPEASVLRQRIQALLDDPDLARTIGERGREMVADRFPLDRFTEAWRRVIEDAAASTGSQTVRRKQPARQVLMNYVASPFTTGKYLEEALRKRHQVMTAGFRLPDAMLDRWGFARQKPAYPPHQVDLPLEYTFTELRDRLPQGWNPDLFLWVDSGPRAIAPDLHALPGTKACYIIDSHVDPISRIEIARQFDVVFLAQQGQIDMFKDAGLKRVYWLPLGCAPELHRLPEQARHIDVAFVGSPGNADDPRRQALIEAVRTAFPNHVIERQWPHQMTRTYARAKIVINIAVNRDVNMRVFEAMASGALLITDEADGLEALFDEGQHYVCYHADDQLVPLIRHYLADDAAREAIANEGKRVVDARHTYDCRMERLIDIVKQVEATSKGQHGDALSDPRFESGGYYGSGRPELVARFPNWVRRVLDVGCGAGEFGKALKARGVEEVAGIEVVEQAWKLANERLDRAVLGSIEDMDELPFDPEYFDCVCFNDVLEHLVDPVAALEKAQKVLRPGGIVMMSIPNMRFYQVLAMLLNGRWQYQDAGIMDRTHLRFFTAIEIKEMIAQAGLEAVELGPLSMAKPDDLPRNADGSVHIGRAVIPRVSPAEYQDFLTFQYLAVGRKADPANLTKAWEAIDAGRHEEALELAEAAGAARDAGLVRAKALAGLERLDEAATAYRGYLEEHPLNSEAAGDLGALLARLGQSHEARLLLESALRSAPDSARDTWQGALGAIQLAEGEIESAYVSLAQAVEAKTSADWLLKKLLEAGRQSGRFDEAIDLAGAYLDFFPGKIEACCAFAEAVLGSERREMARNRLEMASLLAPDDPRIGALLEQLDAASRKA